MKSILCHCIAIQNEIEGEQCHYMITYHKCFFLILSLVVDRVMPFPKGLTKNKNGHLNVSCLLYDLDNIISAHYIKQQDEG